MIIVHSICQLFSLSLEGSIYSRGIAGIGQNLLCIGKNTSSIIHSSDLPLLGNHQGELLLFSIPQKGSNVFLKETIPGRKTSISLRLKHHFISQVINMESPVSHRMMNS